MPTVPIPGNSRETPGRPRRPPRSSTAGRRAVSTSRLDLLARPRTAAALLHAASPKPNHSRKNESRKLPGSDTKPVTIPCNELRRGDSRGKSASLSHLNQPEQQPQSPQRPPKPSRPVSRRATTVGAGVAVERPQRPRRAPPAARSSGNQQLPGNSREETPGNPLLRLRWCSVVWSPPTTVLLLHCMSGYVLPGGGTKRMKKCGKIEKFENPPSCSI